MCQERSFDHLVGAGDDRDRAIFSGLLGDVVAKPRGDYQSTPVEAPLGRDSG